ncbi:MAG: DMT family transporter [Fusobacteriota bacterium]
MFNKIKILPVLAGLMSYTIFGFSFLFTKTALGYTDVFQLLGFRFALAALFMLVLKNLKVIKINLKGKRVKKLLKLSLFQPVIYFIFETLGLNIATSSEAGIMLALIPVAVTILATIYLGEKPSLKQTVYIFLSVFGVIFIIIMKQQSEFNGQILGIILLLGAVLAGAIYTVLSRESALEFKPMEITYIMMWIGAITFNTIGITQHIIRGEILEYLNPIMKKEVFFSVFYLGLFSSIIAFLLLNYMLSKVEAYKSAVFTNFTTIVSVLAGVFLRGEPFFWYHLLGGFLILIGVFGTNYYGNPKEVKEVQRNFID